MNEVVIDAKKIPAQSYQQMARGLLEFIKSRPELIEQYEKETGKKAYKNISK